MPSAWHRRRPGREAITSEHFANAGRRDQVIYYQYRHDRARRTLRGINEQVAKAEQAVAGKALVRRNSFFQLDGGTKTVNRELEEKAKAGALLRRSAHQPSPHHAQSAAAPARSADPIYAGPGSQAGYQAVDSSGFRAVRTTFTVPDGVATGQAGLTGINLTDISAGRMAGCGWLGIMTPDGAIGCYDEAAPGTGWVTLLPAVSPGDSVTVTMTWKASGRMKVTAADPAATPASGSATLSGVPGENWTKALAGAMPSVTTPRAVITLSSFSRTRLAPVCGKAPPLMTGPCTLQSVLGTSNGQGTGQVIAAPTTLTHNAFSVLQQP